MKNWKGVLDDSDEEDESPNNENKLQKEQRKEKLKIDEDFSSDEDDFSFNVETLDHKRENSDSDQEDHIKIQFTQSYNKDQEKKLEEKQDTSKSIENDEKKWKSIKQHSAKKETKANSFQKERKKRDSSKRPFSSISSDQFTSVQSTNSAISDCGSFTTIEENQTVRRSKRNRMKPLEYWKNETIEMKRFSSGVGSILPIPVNVHHSEETTTQHSSKKRSAVKEKVADREEEERGRKEKEERMKKREEEERRKEEEEEERRRKKEEERRRKEEEEYKSKEPVPSFLDHSDLQAIPLEEDSIIINNHNPPPQSNEVTEYGEIILYDRILNNASLQDDRFVNTYRCECQLVGHNQYLPLESLYEEKTDIKGGASLEAENLFISGIFVIPKQREKIMENCGDNCLIGVVLECEDNTIRLQINEKEFRLQKSDVFWVPKMNEDIR